MERSLWFDFSRLGLQIVSVILDKDPYIELGWRCFLEVCVDYQFSIQWNIVNGEDAIISHKVICIDARRPTCLVSICSDAQKVRIWSVAVFVVKVDLVRFVHESEDESEGESRSQNSNRLSLYLAAGNTMGLFSQLPSMLSISVNAK